MNLDQLQGKWKQAKGSVREKWGRLTDDDLEQIEGNKEKLVGRIQERYGMIKEAAEKEVDQFLKSYPSEPEDKSRAAGR